jgi:hypothetical protein
MNKILHDKPYELNINDSSLPFYKLKISNLKYQLNYIMKTANGCIFNLLVIFTFSVNKNKIN